MGDAPRRSPGDWPWSPFVSELRLILEHEDGVQGVLESDVPLVGATRDVGVLMQRPPYLGFTDAVTAALEGWIGRLNDETFEKALLWHFGIAKGSSLDSARARRSRAPAIAGWGPDAYHKERWKKQTGAWDKSRLTRALERIERYATHSPRREERPPPTATGDFAAVSHKVIPLFCGRDAVALLTERYGHDRRLCYSQHAAELRLPMSLPGRCFAFDFGVAVLDVEEPIRFSSISALAAWRRDSYTAILADIEDLPARLGDLLRPELARHIHPPHYVLSLYYVTEPGWPAEMQRSATALLSMPSILLERPEREHSPNPSLDAEEAMLQEGFEPEGISSFGVRRVAHGFASWSGVAYLPIDQARALTSDELAGLELIVQAAWCYANCAIETATDPEASSVFRPRELTRLRAAICAAKPQENTQVCRAREAIVRTSRMNELTTQALEVLSYRLGEPR